MSIFETTDFDNHEQVIHCGDSETGLRTIIAIHDTGRGPSLGGCRMWNYPSERAALRDVLRLSRGMTYKAAIADLKLGGGKSVIIGDSRRDKSKALMRAMGRAVEQLGGRYIVAEDVGTTADDMVEISTETDHVSGLPEAMGGTGDPSPATALGVFYGMLAAAEHAGWREGLANRTVAIQGLGNVGTHLCRYLLEAGARLIVSDIDQAAVDRAVSEFGAIAVGSDDIHAVDADIYAPCALGGTINDQTVTELKAKVVAGSANNPLARPEHGVVLRQRGIVYAPDYVINAGGLITVAEATLGHDTDETTRKIENIRDITRRILEQADALDIATSAAADLLAERKFRPHDPALAA
ncbi:MAG: Glu/Leu/Phe/Val dehydrogenase dimerization domain-containing protein [Pseudomonadota bacterium]